MKERPTSSLDGIPGLTTMPSSFEHEETIERLEREILARGLTIFTQIDHSDGAREEGLELRPSNLIIFGNAKSGTPLMQQAPTSAIDLPLKVLVWEDALGQTWLSYNEPAWIAGRHDASDSQSTVNKMSEALAMIARGATLASPDNRPLHGSTYQPEKKRS